MPGNTSFNYFAEAAFTKCLSVTQGSQGLDVTLQKNNVAWNSSFYPADGDELGLGVVPTSLNTLSDVQGRAMLHVAEAAKAPLQVRI